MDAALRQAVEVAHARLDARTADYLSQRPIALSCRKGCFSCCYAMVVLGLAEAMYVREHLSPGLLGHAENVGKRRLERIALDKDRPGFATEFFLEANPCPLLDAQGACGAHPHRPLACRGVLTDLDASYCAPGAVPALRGKEKSAYRSQLKPHHGPEHYLRAPWKLSQGAAAKLWEAEQKLRGFTVIGEFAGLLYLCDQGDFLKALDGGPEATKLFLGNMGVLGGEWGYWVG